MYHTYTLKITEKDHLLYHSTLEASGNCTEPEKEAGVMETNESLSICSSVIFHNPQHKSYLYRIQKKGLHIAKNFCGGIGLGTMND